MKNRRALVDMTVIMGFDDNWDTFESNNSTANGTTRIPFVDSFRTGGLKFGQPPVGIDFMSFFYHVYYLQQIGDKCVFHSLTHNYNSESQRRFEFEFMWTKQSKGRKVSNYLGRKKPLDLTGFVIRQRFV